MKNSKEVLRQVVLTLLLMLVSLVVMNLISVLFEKSGVVSFLFGLSILLLGFWIVYRTLMLIWNKSREDKKNLGKHVAIYVSVLILLLAIQSVVLPKPPAEKTIALNNTETKDVLEKEVSTDKEKKVLVDKKKKVSTSKGGDKKSTSESKPSEKTKEEKREHQEIKNKSNSNLKKRIK